MYSIRGALLQVRLKVEDVASSSLLKVDVHELASDDSAELFDELSDGCRVAKSNKFRLLERLLSEQGRTVSERHRWGHLGLVEVDHHALLGARQLRDVDIYQGGNQTKEHQDGEEDDRVTFIEKGPDDLEGAAIETEEGGVGQDVNIDIVLYVPLVRVPSISYRPQISILS